MKMIGNVSDWLSYAGGALIKVADSAGSTVLRSCLCTFYTAIIMSASQLCNNVLHIYQYINFYSNMNSTQKCLKFYRRPRTAKFMCTKDFKTMPLGLTVSRICLRPLLNLI